MASFAIRYGRDELDLELPGGLDILTFAENMPGLPDPLQRLRDGLADPFGCAPLAVQARDKSSALIVVSDYTRNVRYPLWLPELLNQLNASGIPDSAIQLYIASGTHRAMTEAEKLESYGDEVMGRVSTIDHDCDAMERMKKIGRTSYGTIGYIDERVFNAELLIITGGIQYHYFAGYSGGRKALLPGCSAREAIYKNHSLVIDKRTGRFADKVRPGIAVGNPVSEDMLQVASQIRPDMCVNVVLNGRKEIAWLGVGDQGYKLRGGAQFLDRHNMVTINEPVDFAVVGSGGHPKDLTLFQAHKALKHAEELFKPGARVIWLAKCEQGEGTEEFQSFRGLSLDECIARAQRDISLYSFCSLSIKMLTDSFDIHMVTDLPAQHVRDWGFTPHADVQSALAALPPEHSTGKWAVVPDCSNMLPVRPGHPGLGD